MGIFPKNKTDFIISYILQHAGDSIKVVQVAKILGVNKGSVSLTVKKLEEVGIVKDKMVDISNPTARALKIFISISKIADPKVLAAVKRFAFAAGVYGSSAKGTDTEDSDIDIWIKPRFKLGGMDKLKLSRELERLLGKRIQIVVLDKDRLEAIKRDSRNFYCALVFSSIVLFGDGVE